ncbi:hypothetical protein HAV15_011083 [Penicillium sp. str. |nr:hypothetical protein HAV15_011083 [Penicillium sp. str. \
MAAQGLRHSLANLMGMTVQRWTKSPTAPTQVTLWAARRFAARQTIHQLHGLRWKKPGWSPSSILKETRRHVDWTEDSSMAAGVLRQAKGPPPSRPPPSHPPL